MHIALARPTQTQVKVLLVAGLLSAAAITLSVLPTLGLGGHQHWLLYLVATGQMRLNDFVSRALGLLPGWLVTLVGEDGLIKTLIWIFQWVSSEGIVAIGEAIAALSATGIGGLIVGAIGAATLG